jgi:hypothetical protein
MAYSLDADGNIINLTPTNPSAPRTQKNIDDDDYNSFVSGLAGIGSGLFKIPEEFISLGASLLDLGLDTNTAAAVENFFDKINPFDDMAEATTTGKVVETLVSLGVPATAGYKIATKLANKALRAKKIGKYTDVSKMSAAQKKLDDSFELDELVKKEGLMPDKLPSQAAKEGIDKLEDEALKKYKDAYDLLPKSKQIKQSILEKSQLFGAGLGGGAIADFTFGDESIGTLGDTYGGFTKRDTMEDEGRGEAVRQLTNRLKFATEGAVFGSVIGGVGGALGKGIKSVKYTIGKDAIDNKLKKIIAGFTPQGVNPREIFELMQNQKNELGRFQTEGMRFARQLERQADDFVKKSGLPKEQHQALKEELAGGIDNYLTLFDKSRLNSIFQKLNMNPQQQFQLLKNADGAREAIDAYSAGILKVIPEGETFDGLRKAIKDNIGTYTTTKYALIERNNSLGKAFKDFVPGDEARETAKTYLKGQIRDAKIPRDTTYPTIDDQADDLLRRLYKNGVIQANDLPDNVVLKNMGLEIEEGILKPKNLPKEMKEFFGEIKNPYYKISSTIASQGALITEVEMLSKLQTLGAGKLFFNTAREAEDALGGGAGDITRLNIKSDVFGKEQQIGDLGFMYTTKEIAEGFTNQLDAVKNGTVSDLYQMFVLTPKGISQQAKTIFSPFTHMRNLLSAGAFTLMNGNIDFANPARMGEAFKRSFAAFKSGRKSQEAFDLYLDYNRRGIVGTNTVVGEIQDLGARLQNFNKIEDSLKVRSTIEKLGEGFGRFRQFVTDTYMAEDDFWKIYNYNFEQGSYRNGFLKNFLKRTGSKSGVETEQQLNTLIKKAKRKEELTQDESLVVGQLLKKVGRLVGRKNITLDDPVLTSFKNISKEIDPVSGKTIIDPRTGAVRFGEDGLPLKDPLTGQVYARELVSEEEPVDSLIKNLSADVTKNNIPNYAYVGDNIKKLRKLPLGTFVAFPAEIIRTGFNTIQRAAREMSIAETRAIGSRRMAGVIGTGAALPVGAVELGKQLSGFTEDEMQALRRFVPSWSENSLLVPTGRDKDSGKIEYIDLSYIYPYDSLLRPARTVMNQLQEGDVTDQNIMSRLTEGGLMSMKELVKPFLSEAIYVEAMADLLLRNGRTRENSQVFRPEDPIGEKLYKGTMHVVDTFSPGSIDQILRIGGAPYNVADKYGRTYDLADEVPGIFGFRRIEVDPEQSFKFMISDFNKSVAGSRATFLGDVLKGGEVSPQQVLNQYLGAEQQRYKSFQNMYKNIQAAKTLGMPESDVINQLNRVSKKTRNALLQGSYLPYVPSKEVRKAFYNNALRLSKETGSPLIDPFAGSLDKIYQSISDNWGNNLLDEPLQINYEIPNLQGGIFEGLFQSTGPVTPATSRPNPNSTPNNPVVVGGAGIIPKGSAAYNDILDISGIETEILNDSTNQGNV